MCFQPRKFISQFLKQLYRLDYLTLGYLSHSPEEGFKGLVQGKVLAIYAAGGSYEAGGETEAFDLQKPSFESWLGFIGLTEVERLVVEPTLSPPEDLQSLSDKLIDAAKQLAQRF